MKSQQLKIAGVLNRKIAACEEILKDLKKCNATLEEQQIPSVLVQLEYCSEDKTAYTVAVDLEWFHSPELRSDFQHCAKVAKDGFIELLEKDLQLMKEELLSVSDT